MIASLRPAGINPAIAGHSRRDIHASARKKKPSGGQGFGVASGGAAPDAEAAPSSPSGAAPVNLDVAPSMLPAAARPASTPAAPQAPPAAALPAFSRDQILGTCLQTSALIAIMGFGLHQVAPLVSPAAHGGDADALNALLAWPGPPSASDLGLAAAVAGGVTGARLAALAAWPDFRSATDASNAQVLLPLAGPLDVAVVSVLPALAEELLFRGALLPAVSPDWRGAAVAGVVFGALHVNGGRNAAFGAWAAAVGGAYGALFLATGNLWAPAAAHGAANAASAAAWLAGRKK